MSFDVLNHDKVSVSHIEAARNLRRSRVPFERQSNLDLQEPHPFHTKDINSLIVSNKDGLE
jgi:hypothetical protein